MFKFNKLISIIQICLSNRPKAPPITRFITGEKDKFSCSATNWTPLTIHLGKQLLTFQTLIDFCPVDTSKSPGDDLQFCVKDGAIRYGDIVRLVDKHTGMSLPCLVSFCKKSYY